VRTTCQADMTQEASWAAINTTVHHLLQHHHLLLLLHLHLHGGVPAEEHREPAAHRWLAPHVRRLATAMLTAFMIMCKVTAFMIMCKVTAFMIMCRVKAFMIMCTVTAFMIMCTVTALMIMCRVTAPGIYRAAIDPRRMNEK